MAAKKQPSRKRAAAVGASGQPRLLTGGNPQIAKGDGDEPVRAYLAAMPGWKRAVGERLDALIVREVSGIPGLALRKAVRWNTPFYGAEGPPERGWFLGINCCTKYVKVSFLNGASLRPEPPVGSKQPDVRYVHLFEDDAFDEAQLADWVRQAAALPGEALF